MSTSETAPPGPDDEAARAGARYAVVTIVGGRHGVLHFHQYDGNPIRDFIPVLVEREVVDHFRVRKDGPRRIGA